MFDDGGGGRDGMGVFYLYDGISMTDAGKPGLGPHPYQRGN